MPFSLRSFFFSLNAERSRPFHQRASATTLRVVRTTGLLLTLPAVICTLFMSAAQAADAVTERQAIFKRHQTHMRALKSILEAGQLDRQAEVLQLTQAILDDSIRLWSAFPRYFPENSLRKGSEAHPRLWTEPDDLAATVQREHQALEALLSAARQRDMPRWRSQYKAVQQACGACHDRYKR